jgi:hypothetical protein
LKANRYDTELLSKTDESEPDGIPQDYPANEKDKQANGGADFPVRRSQAGKLAPH